MVKKSVLHKTSHSTGNKHSHKKSLSPIFRVTKRYSKILLKNILLSRIFYVSCKYVLILIIASLVVYGGYLYIGSNFANDVIVSKSEIVARVAKLMAVPQENPEKVVRVQDADTLKSQNPFYNDVKEGDYIVMYPSLAVIYDLRNNTIIATKKMDK